MAIDFQNEQVISLVQAARELPALRNNRPVAPQTLWRWMKYGVKAGAQQIKLEVSCIGCRTVTSREAVQRFLNACAAARSGQDISETIQTEGRSRTRSQSEAARALDAAGI